MSKLSLRKLPRAQASWHLALAGWRAGGVAVALALPPAAGSLIMVNADDGEWRALLDPREWLAQTAPALAAMAANACDDRQIVALFNSMPRPLTFADGALDYRRIQAQGVMPPEVSDRVPLPRVNARECAVWLQALAPRRLVMPGLSCHGLLGVPLAVEFILGASRLPAGMASTLAVGDIVLITTLTRRVTCQGRRTGHFCQREEMIMIDESHDEIYEEYHPPAEGHVPSFDNAALPDALTTLPLNVEFILQRRFLSIGEVQALFAGKVLELDPACEQRIELRSNGHLLARGELVQLEDRLGVEITELNPDSPHD
ncbi:type III secretion system cytoplasmic ring protein SctQ [Acerihabitans arboris]|uniref:Surface presentation of antigens protein SpaO n=1 Tax=Acerihabitans arboris TaxID=2691583 RepID=A0A845S9V0_9GAMM|nr:type III secretion system cytoplasmic ring protein SctQ [Acerihabitans arboris]NDL61520.1 YscQ/HrcQ family type III secretion apparatus protein [Acerihabitans arboris]